MTICEHISEYKRIFAANAHPYDSVPKNSVVDPFSSSDYRGRCQCIDDKSRHEQKVEQKPMDAPMGAYPKFGEHLL